MLVQNELNDLLKKRAVEEADTDGGHIYRWFLMSKKGTTTKRPVLNMKPGNSFVKYKHFKLEVRACESRVQSVPAQVNCRSQLLLRSTMKHCGALST